MRRYRDFFIPHSGNQYAPHSLQKAAVVAMSLWVLLSFATVNIQSLLWLSSDWLVSTILPAVIVEETNAERTAGALGTLTRSPVLDAAAMLKAKHMADNEYFAHYSPDGISPWYWFNQVSYPFVYAGENLAIHFTDSRAVVDAWMNSPTHRANIMNGNYTEIGVAAVEGTYQGFPTVYVVQLFGRPAVSSSVTTAATQLPPPIARESVAESETVLAATSSAGESLAANTDTEVVPKQAVVTATKTPITMVERQLPPTTTTPETVIEDVVITDNAVALYTNEVSTSTNLTPAEGGLSTVAGTTDDTSPLFAAATQPNKVLQFLYVAIGSFIVVALLLSILIEIRRQQPLQIAYGVLLLLLMFSLYQFHVYLTAGAVVM